MLMNWSPFQIRQLRKALALNERQLARLLGYQDEYTIVALERGDYTPPSTLCRQFDRLRERLLERNRY